MWTFEQWRDKFLENEAALINEGRAILRAHNQHVQAALKQTRRCVIDTQTHNGLLWPGLACNAPSFLASDLGHELANKSGTFGLVWSMAADRMAHCSLRSSGEYDVSAIAKCFGGGGHRNAAGFSVEMGTLLEWLK